jgi:hypothetical protein
VAELEKFVTIIHNKMDHLKVGSLNFLTKNKNIDSFMRLPVFVIVIIAHGHGDI